MIFSGVGAGGPDWGRSSGGRRGNGREPDGIGSWSQEYQMAGEGEDDRQQEGQMAVAGGGGIGGPDGRGAGAGGRWGRGRGARMARWLGGRGW